MFSRARDRSDGLHVPAQVLQTFTADHIPHAHATIGSTADYLTVVGLEHEILIFVKEANIIAGHGLWWPQESYKCEMCETDNAFVSYLVYSKRCNAVCMPVQCVNTNTLVCSKHLQRRKRKYLYFQAKHTKLKNYYPTVLLPHILIFDGFFNVFSNVSHITLETYKIQTVKD